MVLVLANCVHCQPPTDDIVRILACNAPLKILLYNDKSTVEDYFKTMGFVNFYLFSFDNETVNLPILLTKHTTAKPSLVFIIFYDDFVPVSKTSFFIYNERVSINYLFKQINYNQH